MRGFRTQINIEIRQECGSFSELQRLVLGVPTCPHQRLGRWLPRASRYFSWYNIQLASLHNDNVIIPIVIRSFFSNMISGPPHHRETGERGDPVYLVRAFRALPLRLPVTLGAGSGARRTWMRRMPRNDRVGEAVTVTTTVPSVGTVLEACRRLQEYSLPVHQLYSRGHRQRFPD